MEKSTFFFWKEERRLTLEPWFSLCCDCLAESCERVDLEEEKTCVSWTYVCEHMNKNALSGLTDGKKKEKRPQLGSRLIIRISWCIILRLITVFRKTHTWPTFSTPAGGELVPPPPPWWISGVLPLVEAQTASTGCSSQTQHLNYDNTWTWLIDWFIHSWIVKRM